MPFIRLFRYRRIDQGEYLDYLLNRKPGDPPAKRIIEKELVLNTAHITKVEVEYAVPGHPGDSDYYHVDVETGLENAEAHRWYRIFFGSEEVLLASNPDDPVAKVIEDIYNNAIKGRD
jgi:hypothetical protein